MSVLTDAVVNAVAEKVTEKVKEQILLQWGPVLTELVNTREATERLQGRMDVLESAVNQQTSQISEAVNGLNRQLQTSRDQQRKASEILDKAFEELGLGQ